MTKMEISQLPDFLQDRVREMPIKAQKPFLNTITPEWVDGQKAAQSVVSGLKEGKFTVEDLRKAAKEDKQKNKE